MDQTHIRALAHLRTLSKSMPVVLLNHIWCYSIHIWCSSITYGATQSHMVLLNHTWCYSNHTWCSSIAYGAPQSHMVLLNHIWCYSITYGAAQSHMVLLNHTWCSSITHGATQSLVYFIIFYIIFFMVACELAICAGLPLDDQSNCWHCSIMSGNCMHLFACVLLCVYI